MLNDIRSEGLKQFCHLLLVKPDCFLYKMNINFRIAAFRLINDDPTSKVNVRVF